VIGANSHVAEEAVVDGAILWPNSWVDTQATVGPAIAGRHCHIGRNAAVAGGVLGDKSVVTDYSSI
jgi:ADP-glucose pyrophosphorylase